MGKYSFLQPTRTKRLINSDAFPISHVSKYIYPSERSRSAFPPVLPPKRNQENRQVINAVFFLKKLYPKLRRNANANDGDECKIWGGGIALLKRNQEKPVEGKENNGQLF